LKEKGLNQRQYEEVHKIPGGKEDCTQRPTAREPGKRRGGNTVTKLLEAAEKAEKHPSLAAGPEVI